MARVFVGTVALIVVMAFPQIVTAQRLESQAIPGRPFGVGALTFTATTGLYDPRLEEWSGRAFYPVFASGGLLGLLAGNDSPGAEPVTRTRTVLFLFTGDAPLDLTLHTSPRTTVTLRPEPQPPRNQARLLQRWWRAYSDAANDMTRSGDYPPLVQTYLTGMLAQRLGLRAPLLTRLRQESSDDWQQLVDVLVGTERLHEAMLRESLAGLRTNEQANQPVPIDVEWREPVIPDGPTPPLEPMVSHVPEECFYVRFGTFENYVWMEDLMTGYGGDIGRMVTARGQDDGKGDRIRRQLSLPMSALAKLVGGSLIADVALIGRDLYLKDGAAVGVLFQARNNTLLSVSINQQRSATLAAERDAGGTLETIKIGDRNVSFLSTPDNKVRSFYAIDGDYHLVTTSRSIVERFFEAGDGKGALGNSPEFQRARVLRPLERQDTIFAFFSTYFFSGLLSPQYQIELRRRTQALIDLELVRLAQLAAESEGHRSATIEDLVAGAFLPAGFGRQADGSGPIIGTAQAIDSLRGARGTFLPVPDVKFDSVTPGEAAQYQSIADGQFQRWQQLDPLTIAVSRERLEGNRERLTIDANVSPIAEEKYGKVLSILGPPLTQRVVPRAGDIVSAQAHVTGGQFSAIVPPHLLFVGLQDLPVPIPSERAGLLQWFRMLQVTPGYIGAWPKPGFLDWLLLRPNGPPVPGLSRLPFDAWRWEGDGFSVVSFQRDILDSVVPQLLIAEADSPAQLRLQVGDLSQSQLRDWVNHLYYQRAFDTSLANTRLFHSLTQQLRVPPERAREVAEGLLDTRLICPLGGTYELTKHPESDPVWRSTAWNPMDPADPAATYEAPLLKWFRGLELSLTKDEGDLMVRTQLEMQR